MGEHSKIEWTTHTFNPWVGCTKVSLACDHCYAETWAKRSGLVTWGPSRPHRRRQVVSGLCAGPESRPLTTEKRRRIGVHTCPGGDRDSTHSADVDYAELLPSLLERKADNFYVQLASEKQPDRALAARRGMCGRSSGFSSAWSTCLIRRSRRRKWCATAC